jgi:RNA polymerase sigma factor (sigma-70 family)
MAVSVLLEAAVRDTGRMHPEAFATLLASGRTGDPTALNEIWRRYAPAVTAYLRGKGAEEPEEITSETFLAVFRALPEFTGDEAGLKALAFTIARRRLVDEVRRRGRRVDTVTWERHLDDRSTPSAEETAVGRLGSAEARALLHRLAPDQRDVLMLRIFGDLTVEHVAEILGKREGAVKQLQRRGLESLRRLLAAQAAQHGRTEEVSP